MEDLSAWGIAKGKPCVKCSCYIMCQCLLLQCSVRSSVVLKTLELGIIGLSLQMIEDLSSNDPSTVVQPVYCTADDGVSFYISQGDQLCPFLRFRLVSYDAHYTSQYTSNTL